MVQNLKQEAIQAISTLPDNATIEDMMYRLYVIDKIHAGLEDVRNGRVITTEDLKHEVLSW
jgi:predicted transcriptional regulator